MQEERASGRRIFSENPLNPERRSRNFDLLKPGGPFGISAGAAGRAIVQGVVDANERVTHTGWPAVQRLELVEKLLDQEYLAKIAPETGKNTEDSNKKGSDGHVSL